MIRTITFFGPTQSEIPAPLVWQEPFPEKFFNEQEKQIGQIHNHDDLFDYCPFCRCRQFYLSKDFPTGLGCLVMLMGIGLAPWTYGLSLPVFAGLDWLLLKRFKDVINCYRCGTEFRGFDQASKRFKTFMHHIGLKYDKDRGKPFRFQA